MAFAATLNAGAQINKAALRAAITNSPAAEVPARAAAEVAAAQPQPPSADAAAAQEAVDASRPNRAAAAARPPAPVASLRAGQLFVVPLEAGQEAQTRAVLEESVKASGQFNNAPVEIKSFGGVVRQLSTDNSELQLKPYVLVGRPLQYRRATADFAGSILVGVADLFGQDGPRDLTAALTFQIAGDANATPDVFEVNRTSPP
ncbi:MAG TPA: hypothetical protein VFV10_14740, partial [Gammaproteobacteria bacterium]|nr:hypothetical protein [Gammaproteobacteria bacterium]